MRYGIALAGDHVAPRPTCAETVLVVVHGRHQVRPRSTAGLTDHTLLDLAKVLTDNRIDVLVCGGISREEREYLKARQIDIIDNVVASVRELLEALEAGSLRPGFGLRDSRDVTAVATPIERSASGQQEHTEGSEETPPSVDCLDCRDRVCLSGKRCEACSDAPPGRGVEKDAARILEAALDISFESERTLCRLSELIYFCLEMQYQRIGLAYCVQLEEPAEILVRVLRRFFIVYPVCCKIGGAVMSDPVTPDYTSRGRLSGLQVVCNPGGQADVLNRLSTDINVMIGLCIGADCIFARQSDAPVTTLFVKDKSLANNPIGAVYSDYYIKEAIQTTRKRIREGS